MEKHFEKYLKDMDSLEKAMRASAVPAPIMPKTYDVEIPIPLSPAEQAFKTLASTIAKFEKTLKAEEAVGSLLASFGQSVHLQIHEVSRSGQFICMRGALSDGSEATIVQHFTQTSLMLVKVKTEVPRSPIGFIHN